MSPFCASFFLSLVKKGLHLCVRDAEQWPSLPHSFGLLHHQTSIFPPHNTGVHMGLEWFYRRLKLKASETYWVYRSGSVAAQLMSQNCSGTMNLEAEIGVAPCPISPSDPLVKFLLPVTAPFCSADLKVLVPKGGILLPGDTTIIPLNWKWRLPPNCFGLFMLLSSQRREFSPLCWLGWLIWVSKGNWAATSWRR